MPKYTLESRTVFPFASNSFVDPGKSIETWSCMKVKRFWSKLDSNVT